MFAQPVDNLKGDSIEAPQSLSGHIEHKGLMARIRDIVLGVRMAMEELEQNPIIMEIFRQSCDYPAQKGDFHIGH